MYGRSLRGNREISRSTTGHWPIWSAPGRPRAEAGDARAGEVRHRRSSGEADERRGASAAEPVERRAVTEGNAGQDGMRRTPSRDGMSHGLDRVRAAARLDREVRLTALLHHVTIDLLRDAYSWLKRDAAPGVDGVTWRMYGEDLEARLQDLHGRVHRGAYRAQPSRRQ